MKTLLTLLLLAAISLGQAETNTVPEIANTSLETVGRYQLTSGVATTGFSGKSANVVLKMDTATGKAWLLVLAPSDASDTPTVQFVPIKTVNQ